MYLCFWEIYTWEFHSKESVSRACFQVVERQMRIVVIDLDIGDMYRYKYKSIQLNILLCANYTLILKNQLQKITLKLFYSFDIIYYQDYFNFTVFVFLHKQVYLKLFEF